MDNLFCSVHTLPPLTYRPWKILGCFLYGIFHLSFLTLDRPFQSSIFLQFCEIYFEYFCRYFLLAIFCAVSLGTPSRWIFTLWSGHPCLLFSFSFSKYFLPYSLFKISLKFSSSFSVNFGRVCFIMFLIPINSLLLVLSSFLKNSHLFFIFFALCM